VGGGGLEVAAQAAPAAERAEAVPVPRDGLVPLGCLGSAPVPEPVVDDPGLHGGVVAFPQVIEDLLVQDGVPAGAGGLDGSVGLAEDRDDIRSPVLHAAGAELRDRPAPPDDVLGALADAGQPGEKVLVAGVAVGDQVPGEALSLAPDDPRLRPNGATSLFAAYDLASGSVRPVS